MSLGLDEPEIYGDLTHGRPSRGCLELSQVDSCRARLLEVRVRDADLYSRCYTLHMLFLHLANGPAVIITILSGRKSYCLIVFLLKLFGFFSWKAVGAAGLALMFIIWYLLQH